jgi:Fibronectin type III domain
MRTMTGAAIAAALLLSAGPAAMARADSPPTPPANLHAVSVTDTDIVLAWSRSTDDGGAVNYALFFDDNPTPFLTSATTSFDVHLNRAIGMIPGSTHTFRVRAEDGSGNHSFSNQLTASFAPGDNTPPTAPRNLRVVSNTAAGVELAWDPSTDESSFDYRVNGTPCGSLPVSQGTTRALIPGASDPVCGFFTATFTVVALDEFDNLSAPSNAVTVTAVR